MTEWYIMRKDTPSLLFVKDGKIFDLNEKKTVVMGVEYSIDKEIHLAYGRGWWEDEQPLEEIKRYVEQQFENSGWRVDVVLSHTAPLKYETVEVFMSRVDQNRVDKFTEEWLDNFEEKLSYKNGTVDIFIQKRGLTSWKSCLKTLMNSVVTLFLENGGVLYEMLHLWNQYK